MIRVRARVKGEPDTPEFTRDFEYGTMEEEFFFSSATAVEERLRRNEKLNVNQALLVYCSLLVRDLRSGATTEEIVNDLSKALSSENMLIGVPETLRHVHFEAKVDERPPIRIALHVPAGCVALSF